MSAPDAFFVVFGDPLRDFGCYLEPSWAPRDAKRIPKSITSVSKCIKIIKETVLQGLSEKHRIFDRSLVGKWNLQGISRERRLPCVTGRYGVERLGSIAVPQRNKGFCAVESTS